jgi:glutamyl-tRNA synthetase
MDWQPSAEIIDLVRNLALQNALQYEGEGQVGSVMGRIMGTRADLRNQAKQLSGLISSEVNTANSLAKSEGLDHIRELLAQSAPEMLEKKEHVRREGLPELPGDHKGVVLRFAPNPNGPLSFGHSRGLVVNSTYAKQLSGKLILRFDDTDTTVKPPLVSAYDTIAKEVEWLCGFPADKIIIASDRMEFYHQFAEQALNEGFAYVCTCTAEAFREFRVGKTCCPCREREAEENIQHWQEMNSEDGYQPGQAVVRIKTDMTLPNPALRDWPALRIQTNPHPRIGNVWRVWPLLDFQSAVEDHLQNVTHIIRGKDLMDSTRKQKLLYQHFAWQYPETIYWGRVKVHEFGGFSTSQMRKDIEEGIYSGWDDPRLPTLSTLARRGIKPEALRNFWIEIGLSQKDIAVPLATLYSHNTSMIDATAPRLAFVRNPIRIELKGEIDSEIMIRSHPTEELGERKINLDGVVYIETEDHGDVRLKDLCDISSNGTITSIDRSDSRPIVHWVANGKENRLSIPEGKELRVEEGLLESHPHPIGTIVQLERIGYAIIEEDGLLLVHE